MLCYKRKRGVIKGGLKPENRSITLQGKRSCAVSTLSQNKNQKGWLWRNKGKFMYGWTFSEEAGRTNSELKKVLVEEESDQRRRKSGISLSGGTGGQAA